MRVLVTGATGFVGSAAVRALLTRTEHALICQVRTGSNLGRLQPVLEGPQAGRADVVVVNLLSRADCAKLVVDADVSIAPRGSVTDTSHNESRPPGDRSGGS